MSGLAREVAVFLAQAGVEDAAFDARCLVADLPPERIWVAARERVAGRPLQYILGRWDFLRLTLQVGEGVLIPRPETELLCEVVAAHVKRNGLTRVRVLDLCAGSGCVGLGMASLLPPEISCEVTCVELSDDALGYLRRNIAAYPQYNVHVAQVDVLHDAAAFPGQYDLLLSNPPYVESGAMPTLQREVRHEPAFALDGGADGLRFYRAMAAAWLPKLAPGGLCAVEVGDGQAAVVATLWEAAGLREVRVHEDAFGVERVVAGERA